ncbi:MAG: ferritin family protein [Actinobacteria bacterium]|nr:ferritin family protein [Actinomycetota bacterium]
MEARDAGPSPIERLREVIDFAIQREQEAADFYNDVARKVQSKSIADELRKLATVEVGHKERLQKMNLAEAADGAHKQVLDLKIADYVVEAMPTTSMTWQDVVNVGMHRELASVQLYTDLAAKVADPRAKLLFEKLAAEEANHKLFFERIWDEEILMWN